MNLSRRKLEYKTENLDYRNKAARLSVSISIRAKVNINIGLEPMHRAQTALDNWQQNISHRL